MEVAWQAFLAAITFSAPSRSDAPVSTTRQLGATTDTPGSTGHWQGQVVRWYFAPVGDSVFDAMCSQTGPAPCYVPVDDNAAAVAVGGDWPAAGLLRPIVEWSITEFEKQTCLCFVEVDPAETDPESPKYLGADHQSIAKIMAINPVDGWRKGRCAGVEDAPGL